MHVADCWHAHSTACTAILGMHTALSALPVLRAFNRVSSKASVFHLCACVVRVFKSALCAAGSACTSASLEPSYVLRALGVDEEMAHTSIRFGLGRFTTEEEVDLAVEQTTQRVEHLRQMSPLWEMVQDGIDLKSIQWSQH